MRFSMLTEHVRHEQKPKEKQQNKIDEELAKNARENRTTLKYFGIAEADFPSVVVGDTVAIFEDHLESFQPTGLSG